MNNRKNVLKVYQPGPLHMVGDGFPVRTIFPSSDLTEAISPFLLLDYAGPSTVQPSVKPRGVGEHPHRGFETVTIVYQGELEHRDSSGNAGTIGPGDVQWMTAGSGVVHEEMHERGFAKSGGTLQMIQLWVNLPRVSKMTAPRYQALVKEAIPERDLGNGSVLRVIAGEYENLKGPAETFTPVHLYDVRLKAGNQIALNMPEGFNSGVFVLVGNIVVNQSHPVRETELALFDRQGMRITIDPVEDATILILGGKPIDEPVARMGPFVMNTEQELVQAVSDYQAGKMGHLP